MASSIKYFLILILIKNIYFIDASTVENIVGGQDAPDGFAPYLASLHFGEFGHYCGANIINDRWLVTAGHCIYNASAADVKIYVGSNKLSSGGEYYTTLEFYVHEDYDPEEIFKADIGLIKTETPFRFNDKVKPIKLGVNLPPDGALTFNIGWGSTFPGSGENVTIPDNLQLLLAPFISMERCAELSVEEPRFIERQICTGPLSGQGLCYGDSGGAVVYANELIGLPSFVYKDVCATGNPDYSTSVAYFYDWIMGTIDAK